MGMDSYRGSFTWNQTDTAGTNYDFDLGFVPGAVIARVMGPISATDAAAGGNAWAVLGVWVADARRSAAYISADAQASATLLVRHTDNAILTLPDLGAPGGTDSDGDIDVVAQASWPTPTTIRFTVDTQINATYGSGFRVMFEAIGGSDFSNWKVGHFQEPGSSGAQSQSVTDPGFQPDGMLLWSVGLATAPTNGFDSGTQGMFSLGATDGASSWVAFNGGDDAEPFMDSRSYAKGGEAIALGSQPAITLDSRAAVTGFEANGITLNWLSCAGLGRYVCYLAWKGGRTKATSTTTRTDTAQFSGPTHGFVPKLSMFVSCGRAESTADTPTDHAQLSIGSALSASDRGAMAIMDQDSPTSANAGHAIEYDEVYINLSTADPPALQGLMDVVDMTVDPPQYVMDDADPAGAFVAILSWGATPAGHIVTTQFNRGQRPAPFAP